jgi:hypothetical protein
MKICLLAFFFFAAGCHSGDSGFAPGTFGYDRQFLSGHDNVIVLSSGASSVIVSPRYQGKVLTSTAGGDNGRSFGWVHYKAFAGAVDAHMNAYGGENRFWLGPEGGKFSLFFPPGAKMDFAHWKTPASFDTEAWDVLSFSASSVELRKDMQLVNYAGTRLSLSVDRRISIFSRGALDSSLGLSLSSDTSVALVGYSTVNTLTNTGGQAWTEVGGMPCMWLLDMFPPSASTTIIIPYGDGPALSGASRAGDGKPATTDYFGEIAPDRIHFADGVLWFVADGKSRGKLGIHPSRVRPFAGSYDSLNRVLTIIQFDVDSSSSARYLNQEWRTDRSVFSGDAMNAYNDGPLTGGGQMGPFYELESVAPAAFLRPGEAQVHHHAVYHFTGSAAVLDAICRKVLGVGVR